MLVIDSVEYTDYCLVQGERFCEEDGITCPWLLKELGKEADKYLCPMMPQLAALKETLKRVFANEKIAVLKEIVKRTSSHKEKG